LNLSHCANRASHMLGALALATFSLASPAAVVFSTSSMTGDFSVTGFADGTPTTFSASYSALSGSVDLTALADGYYTVKARGSASFVAFPGPGGTLDIDVATATPLFTGFLGASGLTPGDYSFSFGTALPFAIPFAFDIHYDGNASPEVMSALALLGFPFVNPDGAGTLSVSGLFGADGSSAVLDFSESDLSWAGFGATLMMADAAFGPGSPNLIDGSFALRDIEITATPVSAPATLALSGLALLLAAVSARRRR
jgi:hypothetical protein